MIMLLRIVVGTTIVVFSLFIYLVFGSTILLSKVAVFLAAKGISLLGRGQGSGLYSSVVVWVGALVSRVIDETPLPPGNPMMPHAGDSGASSLEVAQQVRALLGSFINDDSEEVNSLEVLQARMEEQASPANPQAAPAQPHPEVEPPQQAPMTGSDMTRYQNEQWAELVQPLMSDDARREELEARLFLHFFGDANALVAINKIIDKQINIDKKIEITLLQEGYSGEILFENRHKIRGYTLYPRGRPVKESTLDTYLTQCATDVCTSTPYVRILKAIKNYDLSL